MNGKMKPTSTLLVLVVASAVILLVIAGFFVVIQQDANVRSQKTGDTGSQLAIADKKEQSKIDASDIRNIIPPYSLTACQGIQNSYECAQQIESAQLKAHASNVSRIDGMIKLKLESGKWVELQNTDPEKEPGKGRLYSFIDYLAPVGHFLVHLQFYEGQAFMLISSRTGETFEIGSLPIISPDKARLVVATFCDAYCNPGISILKINHEGIRHEATFSTEQFEAATYWGSGEASWIDPMNIQVVAKHIFVKSESIGERKYTLRNTNQGWKILIPQRQ